ncbi:RluA family pseudouridine synthase [Candidatus Gottesmanbacteria bacterium]|nr:RluA family pseudouridine synthase [Candidatus Gottesmanbacteria bacterium]
MISLEPKIIYEDEQLLVIAKPTGMVVNKADTTRNEFTLQEWLDRYYSSTRQQAGRSQKDSSRRVRLDSNSKAAETNEFFARSGIVHRLDKDTSGVLIIAKTEEAFINLQGQFKNREVQKKYLALVHGTIEPKSGTINIPIERNPFNRKRFGVFLGGREAVTEYNTMSNYKLQMTNDKRQTTNNYTLLEVFPHTGRTHQIRVHLMHLGHPIVSDILYAGRKNIKADLKFCPRLFLHAEKIEFKHPKTSKIMEFSSKLPKELEKVLLSLRVTFMLTERDEAI